MRESIFSASLRGFFVAACSLLGLFAALLVLAMVLGAFGTSEEGIPEAVYTAEIVPNAKGERKSLSKDAPIILKLNLHGVIGMEGLTAHAIQTQLLESREGFFKDNRVKAVLLHIDTPGGVLYDSDAIYQALEEYKARYKVPIYAYVGDLCASGGMFAAAAADKIYANNVSLIGSVGVIGPSSVNVTQLLEKIGVQTFTVAAGKNKDDLNPLRPWGKDEGENFKFLINYYYDQFVDLMVKKRPRLDREKLINEYGANVYPAPIAAQHGYIDEAGATLDKVIDDLAKHIGIQDDFYMVVQLDKKTWINELFGSQSFLKRGTIQHEIALPGQLQAQLTNKFLYLYNP